MLVLVGFREAVINAIPHDLKLAIGIGIGLFITIIGLVDAGIVIKGEGTVVTSRPSSTRGDAYLRLRAVRDLRHGGSGGSAGALLFGILGTTLDRHDHQRGQGQEGLPQRLGDVARQDLRRPELRPRGATSRCTSSRRWASGARWRSSCRCCCSDFFDTAGTVLGLGRRAGARHARPTGACRACAGCCLVDSLAAAGGGAASASSNTTFIEGSAGIGEGARTGLASVVTGLLFACCLFISPLAGIIPSAATAPILVIVGAIMFELCATSSGPIRSSRCPVLLTIVLMPMTYSITNGVGAGFVSYSVLALLGGRRVHPLMLFISAVFVWYFIHGVV